MSHNDLFYAFGRWNIRKKTLQQEPEAMSLVQKVIFSGIALFIIVHILAWATRGFSV